MRRFSSSDAINFIIEKDKPCIFIDTCILLDVVRIPFREIPINNYFDLEDLTPLAENNVNVFLSELNYDEYKNNIGNVKVELAKHIQSIKSDMSKIEALAHFVGKGFDLNYSSIDSFNLQNDVEKRIDNFIAATNLIELDSDAKKDGHDRAALRLPPSKNGKSSDSAFYCSYLKIWQEIRKKDFNKEIYFLTSNSKDFGKISNVPNPIKHELNDNEVSYINSLSWCYRNLMNEV